MSGHEPVTWEYLSLAATEPGRRDELGAAGWELVVVDGGEWHFKRPRPGFKERVTLEQKRRYYAAWGLRLADQEETA